MNTTQRLQRKIRYIFEREKRRNPKKIFVCNHSSTEVDEVWTEKFFYPRVVVEKFHSNGFVKYGMFNTNSELYMPIEEEHVDLCIRHGVAVYSRTLRIFMKKKYLKRLLKMKNKPQSYEEILESLNSQIDIIYKSGETINLNLIK